MTGAVVGDIAVLHIRNGKSAVLGSADFEIPNSIVRKTTRMKIVVVRTGELRLPEGDLIAEILRVGVPAVRTRVRIGYSGKRSKFSDSCTTIAPVFDLSEKVDAIAAGA
jgi:hypothetical protein